VIYLLGSDSLSRVGWARKAKTPETGLGMAISAKDIDGTRLITLKDVVDIAQAAELKRILMDAIASSPRVCIQLSAVTAIDVTAVQLLWAAVSHVSSVGADLVVNGPMNEEVERSFAGTGIFPILNSMATQPGREESDVLASQH
jgi:anti-anti-sigma factor